MKYTTLLVYVFVMVCSTLAYAQTRKIISGTVACDTQAPECIPLPFTTGNNICTANCSRIIAPSFTDANRMWGNNGNACRTSTDGGQTWANCTTSDPVGSGGLEWIAGASDGSLIVVGRGGGAGGGTANDCIAKRSTNNGVTFGSAIIIATGDPCGGAVTGGNNLICIEDGECALVFVEIGTGIPKVYESLDNGQTWSHLLTTVSSTVPFQSFTYTGIDGYGIAATSQSGFPNIYYTGASWAVTANIPATYATCRGTFVMGTESYYGCIKNTSADRTILNNANVVLSTFRMPEEYSGVGQVSPMYYSPSTGVIYAAGIVDKTVGNLPIGIWVSRDSAATWYKLYEGSTLANGAGFGSIWKHPLNGCLYVAGGSTPQIIRVC
jgi:hypothetical protein